MSTASSSPFTPTTHGVNARTPWCEALRTMSTASSSPFAPGSGIVLGAVRQLKISRDFRVDLVPW